VVVVAAIMLFQLLGVLAVGVLVAKMKEPKDLLLVQLILALVVGVVVV
jgi:hypothetical protein